MEQTWRTGTTIAVAAAMALAVLTIITSVGAAAPPLVVRGGQSDDIDMVEWALERFAQAGLELPEVEFEFAGPELSPCDGAQARAYLDKDPILVRVCWGSEFVLLHELAHVWEAGRLDTETETQFLSLRRGQDHNALQVWADPTLPWESQGREHAANVIAWGVMDEPIVVGRTYPNDRANLVAAYRLLTGNDPVHAEGGEPTVVDRSGFAATRTIDPVGGR